LLSNNIIGLKWTLAVKQYYTMSNNTIRFAVERTK
jgi:hypothetical protein